MRSNIESTNGVIFAERVVMLLAGSTGKETAHRLATEAVRQSRATGRRLREVLAAMPDVRRAISDEQLKTIDAPEHYLGATETMRVRLLAESADRRPPTAES
jgi:3-carboxy-cis,cis-muconate cycloisomerase